MRALALFFLLAPPLAAQIFELDPTALERAGVETATAEERTMSVRIRVIGQVTRAPGSTVEVKTILAGRVDEIHVAPGQSVERGAPLVTLHSHALHEMQGELLRSHSAMRMAENRVEAGQTLYELEGISRLELERRQQEALAARLALHAAEAELEDLGFSGREIEDLREQAELHPTLTLRAPAAGTVLELQVQQHAWLQPYEPLLVIGQPRDLELHLQIAPEEAPRIATGDTVEFYPVGRPFETGRARVVTPVPQIDATTRTVTLRAAIEEGFEELLPGLFIEGTLINGGRTVVAVPESAVIRLGGGDGVFVETGAHRFEPRVVRLGRHDGGFYEVSAGLAAGEEVAVSGVFLLKSALLREDGEN